MANGYPDPAQQPPAPMFAPGFGQGLQGMFGGLRRGFQAGGQALHPYSNRLLLAGMGLLSRDKDAMGQAMKGMIAGSALDTEDADRTKLNKAIQGLMNDTSGEGILSGISGPERGYLLASPSTLSKVLADRMSPPSAGVSINMGDYKIPTNYRAVEPGNPDAGVERIPGVKTEEQINREAKVTGAVASIDSQLSRYVDLIDKYGVEAVPGPAKDQLLTVRRGLQMQLKGLLDLGVLNGPDLELLDSMLWDPSVGGDLSNLPSQAYTAVTGGAKERAKSSAAELRRVIKSIQDSVTGDAPKSPGASDSDPFGIR